MWAWRLRVLETCFVFMCLQGAKAVVNLTQLTDMFPAVRRIAFEDAVVAPVAGCDMRRVKTLTVNFVSPPPSPSCFETGERIAGLRSGDTNPARRNFAATL